ncbi:MAG: dTDP-4-dehydrorhamnose 3,5-epimerase [Verrucomicrobiales bacterium]|nr:dTDP-4-dehydrorhamnose 3,5-epimerase [Verrucomicrobiales bacterium]
MEFQNGKTLTEVVLITLKTHGDHRGSFTRTYCQNEFHSAGLPTNWVQCNHTITKRTGTIRGMHWQTAPKAEGKLIRCLKGVVFDVAVDIRPDSPTYGCWEAFELAGESLNQLFIPRGFAHGFQCLTDDCHLFYQMTEFYAPRWAKGFRWDCAEVAIEWPHSAQDLSQRDKSLPTLPETH